MAEIIYRQISELHPHDRNPRKIQDDDFTALCKSIRENPEYFQARPIILSERTGKPVIIAGNMRFRAAKEIGLEMVPTFTIPNLTKKKENEIMVRDNVSNGRWDYDILANEFEVDDLTDWGVDLGKFDYQLPGMDPEPPKKKTKVCPHCGEEI
jgi:ParB-like chromosome segregation protein Spo0J